MKKEYTLASGKIIVALIFTIEDGKYAEVFRSNFAGEDEEGEFITLAKQGDLNSETGEYENQITDIRFIERQTSEEE